MAESIDESEIEETPRKTQDGTCGKCDHWKKECERNDIRITNLELDVKEVGPLIVAPLSSFSFH